MIIGKKIKELREMQGLSMLKLAKIIGTSDAAICNWENEINEPKATYIVNLANYFGITTDELLGRENEITGNVEVTGEILTEDEKQLLFVYRKLTHQNKNQTLGFAKGVYSNQ